MHLVEILLANLIWNSINNTSDSYSSAQVWSSVILTNSLTKSQTNCSLVDLIDVTLACEDVNSKLVEVVIVAEVDVEKRIGNNLLQILDLRLGHKLNFRSDFEQKVWSWFWSLSSGKILKLEFGWYFAADVFVKVNNQDSTS